MPFPGGDLLESPPSLSCRARASAAAREKRKSVRREVTGIVPCLPDSLCQADRWHTVIQGLWAHQEHIMLMEGRSTLLCVRREARNSHSHGCMLGVWNDNLSSTSAFDKGRSMNLGLLSLCRRMGAIVIGCRYRLRLRYVESDRNPADKGSRRPAGGGLRQDRSLATGTQGPEREYPDRSTATAFLCPPHLMRKC